MKYRPSIFLHGPWLAVLARSLLKTSVRYFTSTDLTLGQYVVNQYHGSLELSYISHIIYMAQGRGGNISIVARGKYSLRKFSLIEISVTMYESLNSECFLFLHCLHFAVVNSDYSLVILKPKQVLCLEAVFAGRDLLAVLPTGYGKSIIFHLLPALLLEKNRRSTSLLQVPPPVVVVISPLKSLIHDQIYAG